MTPVNAHSVVHHGVLNLIDDGGSSSLNTQGPLNLEKFNIIIVEMGYISKCIQSHQLPLTIFNPQKWMYLIKNTSHFTNVKIKINCQPSQTKHSSNNNFL